MCACGLTTGVKQHLLLCSSGSSPEKTHQGRHGKEVIYFFLLLGDSELIKKLVLLGKQQGKKNAAIRGTDKSMLDSFDKYNSI